MALCPKCQLPCGDVLYWVFGDMWCGPCVCEVYKRLPEKGLTIAQIAASLNLDATQNSSPDRDPKGTSGTE